MSRLFYSLVCPSSERGLRIRKALVAAAFGAALLLLYVVDPGFENWRTDLPKMLLLPAALFVLAVLAVLVDPIARAGPSPNCYVSFYRSQLPKLHIQEKHNLPPEDARQAWLKVFRQWNSEQHPNHCYYATSLKARYACQAIYYIQWVSLRAFLVSALALAVLAIVSWSGGLLTGFYSFGNPWLAAARIAFPVLPLSIFLYLRATNRADRYNPTGVWRRWREINDSLKAWWDQHEGQREA